MVSLTHSSSLTHHGWGGFYERLVRSVKTPLKKVIGTAKLNYEEMETMLCEVEGVINTRPLTYIYDDDVSDPLTPSHLLAGRNLSVNSGEITTNIESTPESLNHRLKYLQVKIQGFWNRFQHEYLSELREHHMYTKTRSNENSYLNVGDIVIIKDEKIRPRNSWRMGRVESLVLGDDKQIRGANLLTLSKEGKRTKMTRPLQKIIPLEVTETEDTETSVDENVPSSVTDATPTVDEILTDSNVDSVETPSNCDMSRQRRACAIRGESFRRASNQT